MWGDFMQGDVMRGRFMSGDFMQSEIQLVQSDYLVFVHENFFI